MDYDEITVNSNGWIALGHSEMESFRNYSIPGAGGPSPMVAAFWDDLKTSSGGDVFGYADPDDEFVIIEWSDMRTYYANSVETFQIILYNNPAQPFGDGEIKIQYNEFNFNCFQTEHTARSWAPSLMRWTRRRRCCRWVLKQVSTR